MGPESFLLGFLAISTITLPSWGELYTALADMEELLDTESVLLKSLDNYIILEEQRLEDLRKKSLEFKKEHEIASRDVSEYLMNPLNAYLLVKRLTNDWKSLEYGITNGPSQELIRNMSDFREVLKFPTDEDLSGAAVALMRLQDTYKMDTSSLARGELNGVQYSTQLSVGDCFELGRQSYNFQDFYHTVLWMTEALNLFNKTPDRTEVERWEILEYLAYSTYMEGNVTKALRMTNELLEIVPTHKRALGNKAYYQNAIEKGEDKKPVKKTVNEKAGTRKPSDNELYEMACRGAVSPPPDVQAKLKCRYVHHNNPLLKLGPLKEEELYLKPRIVLYRDVLTDDEIEVIRKLAQPRLQRAAVHNSTTGNLETAKFRICKTAWLKNSEHESVAAVSRRVELMTSLTTSSAEDLQVANYGIGGHYESHYDFTRKGEKNFIFDSRGIGNRIATVLFYMSDVAQGGATVFPQLRLAVWPKKGSAVFWHNLLHTGEGDYSTLHAACPVVAGSKWVCNKWLHEKDQDRLRPCKLTEEEY